VRHFDAQVVDFVVGDTCLEKTSEKGKAALFEKVNWLYQAKNRIRPEYKEKLIDLLKGRVSVEADFETFRQSVSSLKRFFVLVHESVRAGEPFLSSIRNDLERLKFAVYLPKEEHEALAREISARVQNHWAFRQGLEERFPSADPRKLEEIVDAYFSSQRLGFEPATEETFNQIGAIYDQLQTRKANASRWASLLQLDSVGAPREMAQIGNIQAALRREVQFDHFLLKLKEIEGYRKCQREIDAEKSLIAQSRSIPPESFEAWKRGLSQIDREFLSSDLAARSQELDGIHLQAKLAQLKAHANQLFSTLPPKVEVPEDRPVLIPSGEEFYVLPVGNVLFKEVRNGLECSPSGKWIVAEMMDLSEKERGKVFLRLTPDFLKRAVEGKPPYAPVRFDYSDRQGLVPNPKGRVRIFYETPGEVFAFQENRDHGQRTRLVRDKKTELYRRVIVNADGTEKNHPEVVVRRGTKEERTAQVDRLQAIWTARSIAKTVLSGEGDRIDWKSMQTFIEYFEGVKGNDLAERYDEPCFWEAIVGTFGAIKEPVCQQILERAPVHLMQEHWVKGKRKTNLAEGLRRIGEAVQFYRNWLGDIDRFLKGAEEYPELQRDFEWFIPELKAARQEIAAFAAAFPSQAEIEGCTADVEREAMIRRSMGAFRNRFRDFDRLKLALNELQVAQNSELVKRERSARFERRLNLEAYRYLHDPGPSIQRKLGNSGVPKTLTAIAEFIRDRYKAKFPGAPPSPGLLELLSRDIATECVERFGPVYGKAVVASLCDLFELQKSAELFPKVFQTASRAELCFKELYSAVSSLNGLHFEILDTYAAVQRVVLGVERLRSEQAKHRLLTLNDREAVDAYFPSRSIHKLCTGQKQTHRVQPPDSKHAKHESSRLNL
jgi:hypothetical protein